jgi:glycosyltransferase involved in cell wall biosynthesis
MYSRLIERIEEAGRARNFRFLWSPPDQEAVLRLLQAADLFLFPSKSEGTPSAVLEAMACGVVPVVTPLEGFTGVVVRDDVEGIVLQKQEGLEVWSQRVLRLLDDTKQLRKLAANSREQVCRTHAQETAVTSLMKAWALPATRAARV